MTVPAAGSSSPEAALFGLAGSYVEARALWLFARLKAADGMANGPSTAELLAGGLHVYGPALYRLMRVLASVGVLDQDGEWFSLTPMGELLRSDVSGSLRDWIVMTGSAIHDTFSDIEYSVRTGEAAFARCHGHPLYAHLARHPGEAAVFGAAMSAYGRRAAQGLLAHVDWTACSRVADIGGGAATLLVDLLQAVPALHGVLLELPHVIGQARDSLGRAGLLARCTLMAGDFYVSVPGGCDTYLCSSILNNLDDEQALTVLKNIRQAMPAVARLLLCETVIPPGPARHFSKTCDLVALVALGGRVRTADEFETLLSAAGFQLVSAREMDFMKSLLLARPRT